LHHHADHREHRDDREHHQDRVVDQPLCVPRSPPGRLTATPSLVAPVARPSLPTLLSPGAAAPLRLARGAGAHRALPSTRRPMPAVAANASTASVTPMAQPRPTSPVLNVRL